MRARRTLLTSAIPARRKACVALGTVSGGFTVTETSPRPAYCKLAGGHLPSSIKQFEPNRPSVHRLSYKRSVGGTSARPTSAGERSGRADVTA